MLPADCIKPVTIDEYEAYPYLIESNHFYCDVSAATLKYIWNIEDVSKFTPGFARVLAHKLAVDIAAALEKDTTFIYQKYLLELSKAIGQDKRASYNKHVVSRPYVVSRFDQRKTH